MAKINLYLFLPQLPDHHTIESIGDIDRDHENIVHVIGRDHVIEVDVTEPVEDLDHVSMTVHGDVIVDPNGAADNVECLQ